MLLSLTKEGLVRRGVAAVTMKEALSPIFESETERLVRELENAPTDMNVLLSIRADLRSITRIKRQLDQFISEFETASS